MITLILIKSTENRRFGGFASIPWSSEKEEWKDDPNSFLFSLDKYRIYSYKKNGRAIFYRKDYGPCFGNYEIQVGQHFIEKKMLYTGENGSNLSFDHGYPNDLSEDGKCCGIYADELEVFQVIF